jgi:hypothetical protein
MNPITYNVGRCSLDIQPCEGGYELVATNLAKGVSMVVSNPIADRNCAIQRAKQFAGIPTEFDHDRYETWLSHKLGF